MELQQLSVELSSSQVEQVETLLNLVGAVAISLDDAADVPQYEPAPGELLLWPDVVLHALFPATLDSQQLLQMVRGQVGDNAKAACRPIRAADWEAGLEQTIRPLMVTPGMAIVPADGSVTAPAAINIRLHIGLAFGTGQHPTTTLCLRALANMPPRDLDVYDFGCGSGILAMAALHLGARFAWCTDTDPQAVIATRRNAAANDMEHRIWAGLPADLPEIRPQLILANILASTLTANATLLAEMLDPGSRVILSGILVEQQDVIEAAFAPFFTHFAYDDLDEWLCISAVRRGPE